MKNLREALKLYVVTDRQWLKGRDFCGCVESALKNGATMVQLREKDLPWQVYADDAAKIREMCRKYEIPFVINDDVVAAEKLRADGVHVGQKDGSVIEARRLLGAGKIVGVSVTTVEEALLAQRQGADYLGVGAMFPTASKTDADMVNMTTLREICAKTAIPVVAIGGIGRDNLSRLAETGVDGVALISAIFAADDVGKATRELRLQLDSWGEIRHPFPKDE
ncbi:MAG: thiamine phosphate synthase [Desulfuromonadaceae bacterium]|nr:thiamine phosphate synthase [Desulfuromonadaceae bacterium]